MKRYKLLLNKVNIESFENHDYSELNIVFTPNLPKSLKESVEIFNDLNGGVSEETRLGVLDIIKNPKEEMKKMEKEKEKQIQSRDNSEYSNLTDNNKEDVNIDVEE